MALHPLSDIRGIHYAVSRNSLRADNWDTWIHNTWNCLAEDECSIPFDDRFHVAYLRFQWADFEPAPGVYNWAALDGWLPEIIAAGKKLSLTIYAGNTTPPWIYDLGCTQVGLEYKNSATYVDGRVPLPHDSVFRDRYYTMLKAVADYFATKPGWLDTLVMVKNSIATTHSPECRMLPPSTFKPPYWIDDSDDPANDAAMRDYESRGYCFAGYREELMAETIAECFDVIADLFPDVYLGMAYVHGTRRFPANGVGLFPADPSDSEILHDALIDVATRYGTRSMTNNTVMTDLPIYNSPMDAAVQLAGGLIGFQVDAPVYGYRTPGSANDPDGLEASLQLGYDLGAQFIEVHNGNMDPHQDVLRWANTLLRSR